MCHPDRLVHATVRFDTRADVCLLSIVGKEAALETDETRILRGCLAKKVVEEAEALKHIAGECGLTSKVGTNTLEVDGFSLAER